MSRGILLSTLAVWVFIFIFETAVHGFGLVGFYQGETGLFRSPEEGISFFPILLAGHLILSIGIVGLIAKFIKPNTIMDAAKAGAFLGLTIGGGSAVLQFVAQPLPGTLVYLWVGISIVEFAIAAAIARRVLGE